MSRSWPTSDNRIPRASESQTDSRRNTKWWRRVSFLPLAVALVVGASLQAWGLSGKRSLLHDEVISYLVSTGHRGEFDQTIRNELPPYGTWVPAREWRKFIRPDEPLCFGRIGQDLAETDVHPPLYFWLLHVWNFVVGVHIWAGPLLNILISLLSAIALFGLARLVLQSVFLSGFVSLIWIASPNILATSLVTRQYSLLGFVAILFVWSVLRCCQTDRPLNWKSLFGIGFCTAAGLLTHYHFPILIAGCGVIAIARLGRGHMRRLAKLSVAVLLGLVFFVVLHPRFAQSIETMQQRTAKIRQTQRDFTGRADLVVERYAAFLLDRKSLPRGWAPHSDHIMLAVTAGFLGFGWFGARRRRDLNPDERWLASNRRSVLFLLVWTGAINVGLFLAGFSPPHAMNYYHPAIVWPWFAFLPVIACYRCTRRSTGLLLTTTIIVLTAGVLHTRSARKREPPTASILAIRNLAEPIIVDTVLAGSVLRTVWLLRDDVQVLAAHPHFFLHNPERWVDRLRPGSVYVWIARRANADLLETRKRIAYLLMHRFGLHPWKRLFWNLGTAHEVVPREALRR